MAVASLVLGIITLILALFGSSFQWVGLITGIIGIILGAMARKQGVKKGVANAGFICSIIGFALCAIVWIACIACVGGLAGLGAALS